MILLMKDEVKGKFAPNWQELFVVQKVLPSGALNWAKWMDRHSLNLSIQTCVRCSLFDYAKFLLENHARGEAKVRPSFFSIKTFHP